MTTIRVDAEAVAALGADLRTLAGVLAALEATNDAEAAAIGHDRVSGALDELLGNWTLMRRGLAEALDDLGAVAQSAGHAYVLVEQGIVESFGCVPARCPISGVPQ
ncbi:MAG TPA: hypothetical protein GXZ60_13920 [Intrasporangiaceae bacterium]|nr:hypothetical protein [Intrasporangiaceae bacterium]